MGRPKVKEIPNQAQRLIEVFNGPELARREDTAEGMRDFLARAIDLARDPDENQVYTFYTWSLLYIENDKPTFKHMSEISDNLDLVFDTPRDVLKRLLRCPECGRFVWRKKIDSQTCGGKCAEKHGNKQRIKKRKEKKEDGGI